MIEIFLISFKNLRIFFKNILSLIEIPILHKLCKVPTMGISLMNSLFTTLSIPASNKSFVILINSFNLTNYKINYKKVKCQLNYKIIMNSF